MRRVLFVFSVWGYFREMYPVAEYYAQKGWEVHALVGWSGLHVEDASNSCAAAGMIVHVCPPKFGYRHSDMNDNATRSDSIPYNVIDDSRPRRRKRLMLRRVAKKLIGGSRGEASLTSFFFNFKHHLDLYRETKVYTQRLLSEIHPHVVFMGPFQSVGKIDNGIISECAGREIRSCCLPFTVYAGGITPLIYRYNNLSNGVLSPKIEANYSFINRILARCFAKWTRVALDKRLFMFPPEEMCAGWWSGLIEDDPWQKPSERFDVVFVESDFSVELLSKGDYDVTKVIVAGKPLVDEVFRNMSSEKHVSDLYGNLGLSPYESFVLVNVEPAAEHQYSSWETHWQNFASVMDCLVQTGSKVVLSLHPLCDPKNYEHAEEKYGFKISLDYKMVDLYPYCNLALSFPCSTNVFSMIFKKKLIVYDFFGITRKEVFGHEVYRVPGALIAYDSKELRDLLSDGCTGPFRNLSLSNDCDAARPACPTIYECVKQKFDL